MFLLEIEADSRLWGHFIKDIAMHSPLDPATYPKARLDALSDGIFAVAMTLLALDVRLPEDFHPHDGRELIDGVVNLWPKFFPYLLSFTVLGLRWASNIQLRTRAEHVDRGYVNWWLFYLMLITCVPFSTMVVGRHAHLAPAIWLYAGHTLLIALVVLRLMAVTPGLEPGDQLRDRQTSAVVLIAASGLTIAFSFVNPSSSLWALMLSAATPLLRRWRAGRAAD